MRARGPIHAAATREGAIRVLTMTAVVAMVLLAVGSGAVAAAAPTGGAVKVFGVPKGGGGSIVFTGAIGDYGKVQRENANGAANPKGNYVKFNLKQGTFVGNGTALFTKLNNATPAFDQATCSGAFSVSAPMPLAGGTGMYTGISGTLNVRVTFGFVGPRYRSGKHKGQCNVSQNSTPLAQIAAIAGSGDVSLG
jgi:hypothetical protein